MSAETVPRPALPRHRIAVLITAAGRGTRMGSEVPKQWLALGDRSVLARSIAAFAGLGWVLEWATGWRWLMPVSILTGVGLSMYVLILRYGDA